MTSIVHPIREKALHGLSLIIPAYTSAFASIGKVWALFVFGALITISTDFYFDEYMDAQFNDLGWMADVLFWGSPPAKFLIDLITWAKIWTVCFNIQNPQAKPSNNLFGRQPRAAFGACAKVTLASAFLTLAPLTILLTIFTTFNVLTQGYTVLSEPQNAALGLTWSIIYQIIIGRYLIALPISLADESIDLLKRDFLGNAWRLTKEWYPTILGALIPIALIEQVLAHIRWSMLEVALQEFTIRTMIVLSGISDYAISAISILATLHVILNVWSQTRTAEFD